MCTGHKKTSNSPGLSYRGCEHLCRCWELNSGPLKAESALNTTLSLQPRGVY